jgi:hypothetical protein
MATKSVRIKGMATSGCQTYKKCFCITGTIGNPLVVRLQLNHTIKIEVKNALAVANTILNYTGKFLNKIDTNRI